MAATGTALKDYSTTPGSNGPSGTADPPSTLDDSLRNIASVIRYRVGTHGSIASAATCDIGTKEERSLAVTGTTGITSFGTSLGSGGYGIVYELTFDGALTLTHSSSLACITNADITTAAGDSCAVRYSATGWTMLWYARKTGQPIASSVTFGDGTVSAPGISFTSDTDNGFYRIGANNWAAAVGGSKVIDLSATSIGFTIASGVYSFGAALSLVSAAANNVTVSSAGSSGATGSITLGSGDSTGASAGYVDVSTGDSLSSVGDLSVHSGSTTTAGSSGGTAGEVKIYGGDAAATNGNGGTVSMWPGGTTPGAYASTTAALRFGIKPAGTVKYVFRLANSVGAFVWDTNAGSPTISSGAGTGATIVGTNYAFTVTLGTTPGTSVVIDMASWLGGSTPNVAACVASYTDSGLTIGTTHSGTQVTLALSGTPTAGKKLHVMCAYYV